MGPRNLHPLSSNNYDLATINCVHLQDAPKKTRWSDAELDVFEYVLKHKLDWKPNQKGSISWTMFASYWKTAAKVKKLNSKSSVVYIRDKDQLEQLWKDKLKTKMMDQT